MTDFDDLIKAYGELAQANLRGGGEPEAALAEPVTNFVRDFGKHVLNQEVFMHPEMREEEGAVRPDFGVRINRLMSGYVELKKPGTSLDPTTYGKTTHNARQWKRLANLPNLLHTDGVEWRLWRYGELVGDPVQVHTSSLTTHKGALFAPTSLSALLTDFLTWTPTPITTVNRLIDTIAPLAVLLREEVLQAVKEDRRKEKQFPGTLFPFTGLKKDWRASLYPNATDKEFADGFAQTVVFALVVGLSEGMSLEGLKIPEIARALRAQHTLLGRALDLLTEHIEESSVGQAVEVIVRALSGAQWQQISQGSQDVYLHLYENFLSKYDPEMRKKSGSYYTPVQVVDAMVNLTDEALKKYLNIPDGLASESVAVIDPAMGTGTYPLSVLRHVAREHEGFGAGAVADAITSAAKRLYGIELQSGPYSVAELRLTNAVREYGGVLPEGGLQMFVADTLEDPYSGSSHELSYTLQMIAQQRIAANKVKMDTPIQVCIGNPPYKDKSEGMGGWIERGNNQLDVVPLDDFRYPDNGKYEYVLKNLYVYFWRWAMWKVFESVADSQDGVVCFITAGGYLNGPGFKGMRQWIRENTSRGWIINVTPEGKQPPATTAVFNIETPVSIAVFVRDEANDKSIPANVKYTEVHGLRQEKFDALKALSLDDEVFVDTGTGWTDGFVPAASAQWTSFPALNDLFPWVAPGIKPNKTWVYNPSAEILEQRWTDLVMDTDLAGKKEKFVETRDSSLLRGKSPLPGDDTEQNTQVPFTDVTWPSTPKIVRVGYRSFDRQYIIADSRLLATGRPDLWAARSDTQLFFTELHSDPVDSGPGLTVTNLVPDMHHFKGSEGGRVLPIYHADGSPNTAPQLLEVLGRAYGREVSVEDLASYIAGISAHPGYVEAFSDPLRHDGNRIPMTGDPELWQEAVEVGSQVIWAHTFGERGTPPQGVDSLLRSPGSYTMPMYDTPVGAAMPEGVSYDQASRTISMGKGTWSNVDPRVWEYTVGGNLVIESWVGYRRKKPKGRKSGPLSDIITTSWPQQWSTEFSEILAALTHLVHFQDKQDQMMGRVLAGELVTRSELSDSGVMWPVVAKDRKARKASGSLF